MTRLFALLRIHQWIKNCFIFLPMFFAQRLYDTSLYFELIIAFFGFSFVSSSVYIINDCQDLEFDKLHPKKSKRPIAAGDISKEKALIICVSLFITGVSIAYFLNKYFFGLMIIYFCLNLLYSFKFKHIAIIDILIIAICFLLRLWSGGVICNVYISNWILLTTFLLALFLALAKRRDDLIIFEKTSQKMRQSIDGYTLEFVNASMVIMASVIIFSYILYCISPNVTQRIGSDYVYLTSFFVILSILRYLQISFVENNAGSPTEVLLRDLFIQLMIVGWVGMFFILLYWK